MDLNFRGTIIRILIFAFAWESLSLALAQDVAQPLEAIVGRAKPVGRRYFLSDEQDENADGALTDNISPGPSVYVQIGGLFLQRQSRFIGQPIVVDPNTGTTFLSTSDFNSSLSPGLQATVGMQLCGGLALEFDYFGLLGGAASAAAFSPDPGAFLIFPDNLFGNVFVDLDGAQVNYSTWLQSFALNLLCLCECCDECCDDEVRYRSIAWFAGPRYLNVGDTLNIAAQRTVAGAVEEGAYNIRAVNQLYGAQLGARFRRWRGRFGWDATGSAGVFVNNSQQTQSVTDFPNFPLRPTVSSRGVGTAFVGWANLSALYLLTDRWNFRAGYNVMWIEGLALAPDQLDFNFAAAGAGSQLHYGGGMFLHGVNVGLEGRW